MTTHEISILILALDLGLEERHDRFFSEEQLIRLGEIAEALDRSEASLFYELETEFMA